MSMNNGSSYHQEDADAACERSYRRGVHQTAALMLRLLADGCDINDIGDFVSIVHDLRASTKTHPLLLDEAEARLKKRCFRVNKPFEFLSAAEQEAWKKEKQRVKARR